MKTRSEAFRQARVKRILLNDPKNWKIRVWENFGWHWNLSKGGMTLYWSDYGAGSFGCLLSRDVETPCSGEVFWSDAFHHKNPNVVVTHQVKLARKFIEQCSGAIRAFV